MPPDSETVQRWFEENSSFDGNCGIENPTFEHCSHDGGVSVIFQGDNGESESMQSALSKGKMVVLNDDFSYDYLHLTVLSRVKIRERKKHKPIDRSAHLYELASLLICQQHDDEKFAIFPLLLPKKKILLYSELLEKNK